MTADNYIDILEQVCIEDLYSKHQERELVLLDMEEGLYKPIDKALTALYTYFDTLYSYDSKNERINEYVHNKFFDMHKVVLEVLVIILPNKHAVKIQSVVGKLATFLNYDNHWDGIKTAAEIVTVIGALDNSLYDIIPARHSSTVGIEIIANYQLKEDTLQQLSNFKYLPPMIVAPSKISRNNQSAYLTKNESIVLGANNHHAEYLALGAINIANSIELSLDTWLLDSREEKPSKSSEVQQIKKNGELETKNEMRNRHDSHVRMVKSSNKVYVDLVESGNKFYLTWKYDKRGRMYCSGYHVSIQAAEYKKAIINLANKQVIRLV